MAVVGDAEACVSQADERAAFLAFDRRYEPDCALFVREVLNADPDPWQIRVCAAYDAARAGRGKRRLTIRSGHGVGKTALLAWLAIHQFLFSYPQKTVCTAASEGQLKDGLIAEMKTWIARLPAIWQQMFVIKVERIERPAEVGYPAAPEESFISFKVSKAENPEALAGVHSKHVLLIVDEASAPPDVIYESASGSMADPNSIMVLAGNMVRNTGLFFNSHFKDPAGEWVKFHVSSVDSPRTSRENIEYERTTYGERSNRFRVRVLGEPPLGDDDTVIPYEWLEQALDRNVTGVTSMPVVWGVDVSYGGSDASALAKRRGNRLLEKTRVWYNLDTQQFSHLLKLEWEQTPIDGRPADILVDSIGYGAGVVDRLREFGLPARGINVSETPTTGVMFRNLRSENWFKGRQWFMNRDCSLNGDQALLDELAAQKVHPPEAGKFKVWTKKEMKMAGHASPNRADAFLLTFARDYAIALSGSDKRRDWKQPMKRVIKGIV